MVFLDYPMNSKNITFDQVKEAHKQNVYVALYGVVTDKGNYAAIEKCPDFIQTDDIIYLLKVFKKYKK